MTSININWQELIQNSGGLTDTVSEIDSYLEKFGKYDLEKKLKIMIGNIASYFKKNLPKFIHLPKILNSHTFNI